MYIDIKNYFIYYHFILLIKIKMSILNQQNSIFYQFYQYLLNYYH